MIQSVLSLSKTGPRTAMALAFGGFILYILTLSISGTRMQNLVKSELSDDHFASIITLDNVVLVAFLALVAYVIGTFCIALGSSFAGKSASSSAIILREGKVFETQNGLLIQRCQNLHLQLEFLAGLFATLALMIGIASLAAAAGVYDTTSTPQASFSFLHSLVGAFLAVVSLVAWISTLKSLEHLDNYLDNSIEQSEAS
jgi:hypothetical protein